MKDKVFGKAEEDKTTMEKLEEEMQECCPTLTYTQRLIGFAICVSIAFFLTLGSFMRFAKCIHGDCTTFAVVYSVGNILAVLATFFLTGPHKQFKQMFDSDRLCATCTFLTCLVLTLVFALVPGLPNGVRTILVIVSAAAQLLAYVWYAISYIPFARTCVKKTIKSTCGSCFEYTSID